MACHAQWCDAQVNLFITRWFWSKILVKNTPLLVCEGKVWIVLCTSHCRALWVRCLVTKFCYQLIAKPGNKTATHLWSDPCAISWCNTCNMLCYREVQLYSFPDDLYRNCCNQDENLYHDISYKDEVLLIVIISSDECWLNFRHFDHGYC